MIKCTLKTLPEKCYMSRCASGSRPKNENKMTQGQKTTLGSRH